MGWRFENAEEPTTSGGWMSTCLLAPVVLFICRDRRGAETDLKFVKGTDYIGADTTATDSDLTDNLSSQMMQRINTWVRITTPSQSGIPGPYKRLPICTLRPAIGTRPSIPAACFVASGFGC